MKKKIVSLLVILTTLCLFVPCITFAAVIDSGACGENLTWTFDDNGTLTISGTGDMYDYGADVSKTPWGKYYSFLDEIIIKKGFITSENTLFLTVAVQI